MLADSGAAAPAAPPWRACSCRSACLAAMARPVDEHDQSRCGVAIAVDRYLVRAFGYLWQQHLLTGGSKDEHPGRGQGQRACEDRLESGQPRCFAGPLVDL